jgi:hypothetical protein
VSPVPASVVLVVGFMLFACCSDLSLFRVSYWMDIEERERKIPGKNLRYLESGSSLSNISISRSRRSSVKKGASSNYSPV